MRNALQYSNAGREVYSGEPNLKELARSIKKHEENLAKLQSKFVNKTAAIATKKENISHEIKSDLLSASRKD